MRFPRLLAVVLLAGLTARAQNELRVPAFTAYLEPDSGRARISSPDGIAGWDDPAQKVLWFGDLKTPGKLDCSVLLGLPAGAESRLRLGVAEQSREVTVKGTGAAVVKADFGSFDIPAPGFQRFTLASLNPAGQPAGNLQTLVLDGPAAAGGQFNLDSRRNAASVHLMYPVGDLTNVDAFYCEVTGVAAPLWTYFMACGWHRGYFGMQVNSPTERRIIFSVWDSGHEGVDRSKVAGEDRTTLVAKGDGVYTGDFGNEGTGGHSHLACHWQTGEKQRFVVTAKPTDATHTIYAGHWFDPEQKKWVLISSWRAPKDGAYLHGLYSFIEDFNGDNGQLNRRGGFGNQWVRTADGRWHEVTTAGFSCDPTGKAHRFDRFMGVEDGQFFLSTGGFLSGCTTFGGQFTRPATRRVPSDLTPPPWQE